MIDPYRIAPTDLVMSVAPGEPRQGRESWRDTRFWIVADGPAADRHAEIALAALRASDWPQASGAVTLHGRPVIAHKDASLPGPSIDLRGATGEAEVSRRLAQWFAPTGARNEWAAWGDKALDAQVHATLRDADRAWPSHREGYLRDVGPMRAELALRAAERAAAAEAEPEAPSCPAP